MTIYTKKPRMTNKLKAEIQADDDKYNDLMDRNYTLWEKLKHKTLPKLLLLDLSYDVYSTDYDKILDTMDTINLNRIRIREVKERAFYKVRGINAGNKKYDFSAEYRLENRTKKNYLYYTSYKIDLKTKFSPVLRELVRDFNHGVNMTEDEFKCIQQSNSKYESSSGMTYKKYREVQIRQGNFKRMEKRNTRKILQDKMNNDCIVNICQFI